MLNNLKKTLSFVLIAGIGGFAGAGIYNQVNKNNFKRTSIEDKQPVKFVNYSAHPETDVDFTKAAEMTVHAVVHVKTFYERQNTSNYNPFFSDPFRDFFGDRGNPQQQPQQQEASGSGVIISDDGYIVTNNHVVDNANKIEITLNDKRTYTAKVIGADPSTDLALLKIDEKNLSYIVYGNSDEVKVGEWVLAVGNPFNLTSTVTAGIVSAKARNINILNNQYKIEAFIQTDAAVNPGNSGGALVNTHGQLIGINAAIASNTGSYTGYSFAIPVNIVKKVVNDLLEFGEVQRGFLGVSIRDLDYKLAEEKGIKQIKGVYVAGLNDGSAAKDAGIKEGDVITKIGNVETNSSSELQEQVSKFRPGDKVNVTLMRAGKENVVSITLKNRNGNTEIVKKEKSEIISMLGAEFETTTKEEQNKLRINGGVKITKLNNGKLRNAGIREGFIVTKIDRKEIKNTEDLIQSMENKQGGILIEGIYPNGMRAYYAFGL